MARPKGMRSVIDGRSRGGELFWRSEEELEVEAEVAGAKPHAVKRQRLSGACCSGFSGLAALKYSGVGWSQRVVAGT